MVNSDRPFIFNFDLITFGLHDKVPFLSGFGDTLELLNFRYHVIVVSLLLFCISIDSDSPISNLLYVPNVILDRIVFLEHLNLRRLLTLLAL